MSPLWPEGPWKRKKPEYETGEVSLPPLQDSPAPLPLTPAARVDRLLEEVFRLRLALMVLHEEAGTDLPFDSWIESFYLTGRGLLTSPPSGPSATSA